MANMKFFNVLQPPTQGADDGTYYVKKGDKYEPVLVSDGVPYEQEKGNAIDYTFNRNKEAVATAYDPTTGIFTVPNHGFNDIIFITVNVDNLGEDLGTIIPKGYNYSGTSYRANYIDKDHFNLQNASDPTPILFEDGGDFTKWHFEQAAAGYIKIDNLKPFSFAKVSMLGLVWDGVWLTARASTTINNWIYGTTKRTIHQPGFGSSSSYYSINSIEITIEDGMQVVELSAKSFKVDGTVSSVSWSVFKPHTNNLETSITIESPSRLFKNGTRIKIITN